MTIGQISLGILIVTTISAGLSFILGKIISRTKHETTQDDKLQAIAIARNECIIERERNNNQMLKRIESLEKKDTDREITLVQIKEQMESLIQRSDHTQTMISQLTEHQQVTFTELIKTINKLG